MVKMLTWKDLRGSRETKQDAIVRRKFKEIVCDPSEIQNCPARWGPVVLQAFPDWQRRWESGKSSRSLSRPDVPQLIRARATAYSTEYKNVLIDIFI